MQGHYINFSPQNCGAGCWHFCVMTLYHLALSMTFFCSAGKERVEFVQISGCTFGNFNLLLNYQQDCVYFWLRLRSNLPPQCCWGVTGFTLKQKTAGLGRVTLALFYLADSTVLLSVRVANKILIHSNNYIMWAKEQKEIVAWLETGKQTLPNQTGTVGVNERLRIKPFFLAFCIVFLISKRDVISPGLQGLKQEPLR